MIGLEFIKGAALLLSLTLLQGFVLRVWPKDTPAWRAASGLLFGAIILVGMLLPLELQPGVIFDPRSVILCIAGFWGGPIVGAIAGLMASAYRIWLGGIGMIPGVAVIIWSVAAGVAYRRLHRERGWPAGPWPMLGFGFIVHLGVVLLFLALFGDVAWDITRKVALPNLLIFSPATLFLGFLLADIDRRVATEDALRRSEERYRTIVESVGEGVWEIDAETRTTFVNHRLTELLGHPRDEMIGRPVLDFVDDSRRSQAERQLSRSAEGTPERGELLLRRKDGGEVWATVSISPRMDEEGRFRSATALVTDISADRERQERIHALEKQLLHTSRASLMGELASSFAHQLNQPLAGISSFSQGLIQRFASGNVDPPELQKVLAIIDEQSRRAAEIVRRIRQFLQKRDEIHEIVDVNTAIHEVKALLHGEARRRDVDIQIHPIGPDMRVNGDPVLLQQVFANIVTNAFEAMADVDIGQRLVEISSFPDADGLVKIEFRDHGPGLDEEAQKRVFDPFFTRKVHGLGMGLAICRSIVERYGGRIRAGNHGGGGAVFEISLPAAKEAADAPES